MKLIDAGAKQPANRQQAPRLPAEVPAYLASVLKKNAKARAAFDAFPARSRREYIEWLTEAKREETLVKHLVQAVEWMAEGKRRNWKYGTVLRPPRTCHVGALRITTKTWQAQRGYRAIVDCGQ
jgi:hypothetical protein